jgi:hypothetical protein
MQQSTVLYASSTPTSNPSLSTHPPLLGGVYLRVHQC